MSAAGLWGCGRRSSLRVLLTAWVCGLLVACGDPGQEDIQVWMSQQAARAQPRVTPLVQPPVFAPQSYGEDVRADPFNSQKLLQALRRDNAQAAVGAALLRSEQARRKQPLESVALDTMAMVGSLVGEGQPAALVRVDKTLHTIRPGAYLGQNFGKVVQVTDTQVVLREIVQDELGNWVERMTALRLQQGTP